jgi:hypothetical protein
MTPEERAIVDEIATYTKERLEKNYMPGFGVFPTSDPDDNYYNQVWCRDFSHAAGNYFVWANPQAVLDSLTTIFKYQEKSGGLPYRIEREYTWVKVLPRFDFISKPLFNFVEGVLHQRKEKPKYESRGHFAAGDTIPAVIIATGDFFEKQEMGKQFVKAHYEQIKKAVDYFNTHCDPSDGLAVIKGPYPDWADTIKKQGKLGTINIWWGRALERMAYMAEQLNQTEDAQKYRRMLDRVRRSIIYKLYNSERGYFKTRVEGFSRISTSASVFGSYLLSPAEAVRIEETLAKCTRKKNGYINFYPPYPKGRISLMVRLLGHGDYHNKHVWPWITLQNIHIKIRIAQEHVDAHIREHYKTEAVADLLTVATLFKTAGGAYEIFETEAPRAANGPVYKSAHHFMANMAGYQGAYQKLKILGWL